MVLMHCHTLRRFRVDGALIDLLSALAQWVSLEELATTGHPLAGDQLAALVDLGVVEERLAGTARGRPLPPAWSRHFGGTRWTWPPSGAATPEAPGRPRSSPVVKPRPRRSSDPSGPGTALPPPANLGCDLQDALSHRRSVRRYAERPLTLAELSTVLHHTARITTVHQDPVLGDVGRRPFASAGGRCKLEVYVVANDVAGLAAGAHYYDPRAHQPAGQGPPARRPSGAAQPEGSGRHWRGVEPGCSGGPAHHLRLRPCHVEVPGMGLALIHKDVGCFLQTLYLVATAMGLAPCAVGGGEEAAISHWLGFDPLVESQVACLLLGPARDGPRTGG